MPPRRPRAASSREDNKASQSSGPTYVLRQDEPARVDLKGREGSFRIRTPFEPIRERTRQEIEKRLLSLPPDRAAEDLAVVERQWGHLDFALKLIRENEDAAERDALINGLGGALALGFFHEGGPFLLIERKQRQTIAGRKALEQKLERQLAATIRQIALTLARPIWDADRQNEGHYQFLGKHTAVANSIFPEFAANIRQICDETSVWYPPEDGSGASYESYRTKMINAIRWAYKEYSAGKTV